MTRSSHAILDDIVAVIADHTSPAKRGLSALAIAWDEGPNAKLDSQKCFVRH
jgi:isoquinoline 1-oxidoreductase subunit beta